LAMYEMAAQTNLRGLRVFSAENTEFRSLKIS